MHWQFVSLCSTSFFAPSVFNVRRVTRDGAVTARASLESKWHSQGPDKVLDLIQQVSVPEGLVAICSPVKSVNLNAVFPAPWDHTVLAWGQHFPVHTICHHVVTYVMASQQCTTFQCHAKLRCSTMSDRCGNHMLNSLRQTKVKKTALPRRSQSTLPLPQRSQSTSRLWYWIFTTH